MPRLVNWYLTWPVVSLYNFKAILSRLQITDKSLMVKSISLAGALEKAELELCDLLKLDCEGAEYSILFSAPRSVLERFKYIVMEYHDNVTQYNHEDLMRFLTEQGFQVETFPNPVHAYLGYLRAMRQS